MLPKILEPAEVDELIEACRRWRGRAMVEAMVLGGLRRIEVLGLGLADLKFAERRVFIAEGKGGHQRIVPVSARFFDSVAHYLDAGRPEQAAPDGLFVVLKGPTTGGSLTAKGLAQCSELRHTFLTRLREAGMSQEPIQAQPGTGRGRTY